MLTGAFYPDISGAGLQALSLCRSLSGRFTFHVITTTRQRDLSAFEILDGIRIYRIPLDPEHRVSKLTALWKFFLIFLKIRFQIELIHHHGFSDKTLWSILLARISGLKILHKFTSAGDDDPASIQRRRFGRLKYWFLKHSNAFVSPSPALDHLIRQSTLPTAKIHLIPNGVDCRRFQPIPDPQHRLILRRRLGLPESRNLILFVGFFSSDKAPDIAYQAWKDLPPVRRDTADLIFIGSIQSRYSEISQSLAETIQNDIRTHGFTGQIHFIEKTLTIEDYYQAGDCFIMPSRREGLPNALLEAMACGLPCIVNRLPGITDHLIRHNHNGLIMDSPQSGDLTACLIRLMENESEGIRMGRQARQTILSGYSSDTIADRYAGLYHRLITSDPLTDTP